MLRLFIIYECLGLILGVFPSRPRVQFIAVLGKVVGVGLKCLCLPFSRFLFSIRYLVPTNDLRFFVALAGMFPSGIHRLGVPAGIHCLGVPANNVSRWNTSTWCSRRNTSPWCSHQ